MIAFCTHNAQFFGTAEPKTADAIPQIMPSQHKNRSLALTPTTPVGEIFFFSFITLSYERGALYPPTFFTTLRFISDISAFSESIGVFSFNDLEISTRCKHFPL